VRLKFEKGMTPELIAKTFVNFIRDNNMVIGAVNVYIQTYDNEMKPEKFKRNDDEFYVCKPSDTAKKMYQEDVVKMRRKRMKAI